MTIVVDSSQWTGQYDDRLLACPIVWGEFTDEEERNRARSRLEAEPWLQDAHARLRRPGPADNEQVITPDENPAEADARNQRQLHVGTAMAATSMGAAGLVIATGGAALPAVAAAAAAGAATAAVGETAGAALEPHGTGRKPEGRKEAAQTYGPLLGVAVLNEDLRTKAEQFLQANGAGRVWVQETRAG